MWKFLKGDYVIDIARKMGWNHAEFIFIGVLGSYWLLMAFSGNVRPQAFHIVLELKMD